MTDGLGHLEAAISLALAIGPPVAWEACEPEERAGLMVAARGRGRSIDRLAARLLADEAEAGRIARWRGRLARHSIMRPDHAALLRDCEARALAWLSGGRARMLRPGFTEVIIGAQPVRWHDADARWSLQALPRSGPVTVEGHGIVSLWMLARDVTGLEAEAEIAEVAQHGPAARP